MSPRGSARTRGARLPDPPRRFPGRNAHFPGSVLRNHMDLGGFGAKRFGYTAQVTKPGVLVLLALLAASPIVALLPYDTGSIRLFGLSLEWWYCGVVAPVLAMLIAAAFSPGPASSPPAE